MTIRLAEAPINDLPTQTVERTALAEERLGINVEEMDAETAQAYGLETPVGVVLSNVQRASPAARRQVQQYINWRLIRINDTEILSTDDVRDVLAGVEPGQIVQLYFQHPNGDTAFENVRMPS